MTESSSTNISPKPINVWNIPTEVSEQYAKNAAINEGLIEGSDFSYIDKSARISNDNPQISEFLKQFGIGARGIIHIEPYTPEPRLYAYSDRSLFGPVDNIKNNLTRSLNLTKNMDEGSEEKNNGTKIVELLKLLIVDISDKEKVVVAMASISKG
jgi:hypothetical protein